MEFSVRLLRLIFSSAVISAFAASPALSQKSASACGSGTARLATIADIDERLELTLDSGIKVRLAGVLPAGPTAANPRLALDARDLMKAWLVGREVTMAPLAAAPDRWGRIDADVFARVDDASDPMSVAEAVVDAGLGRAYPDKSTRGCMKLLLSREHQARLSNIGMWADPAFAVLRAADRASFTGKDGDFVVVEGPVTGTGQTAARTYVNFGPIRTVDFSVTVRRQSLKALEDAGLHPLTWENQIIRVRGQLDTRFGPQIEINEPSAIEIIDAAGAPPQSRPVARR
jgi:hypothetical protein